MEEYKGRIIEELSELHRKMIKLEDFLSSTEASNVADDERALMINQLNVMTTYHSILKQRMKIGKRA